MNAYTLVDTLGGDTLARQTHVRTDSGKTLCGATGHMLPRGAVNGTSIEIATRISTLAGACPTCREHLLIEARADWRAARHGSGSRDLHTTTVDGAAAYEQHSAPEPWVPASHYSAQGNGDYWSPGDEL